MTDVTSCGTVKLPSAYERQQIFYWLQQISSVTAWRRILSYFDAWALATDLAARKQNRGVKFVRTYFAGFQYTLGRYCQEM